jgi:hypothetical protein
MLLDAIIMALYGDLCFFMVLQRAALRIHQSWRAGYTWQWEASEHNDHDTSWSLCSPDVVVL